MGMQSLLTEIIFEVTAEDQSKPTVSHSVNTNGTISDLSMLHVKKEKSCLDAEK